MASRAEQKQEARARRLAAEEADRRTARRRASIMRLGLVLGLAVVAVVVAVVVSSSGGKSGSGGGGGGASPGDAAAANALFRGIPQNGLGLGGGSGSKAPTLIEFADLQCPYCAEYSNGVLPTVVKQYVRSGKIRYQLHIRSFLGPDSIRAAGAAAVATQDNRLYQFADLFYRNQGPEESGYADREFILRIAGQVPGLDAQGAADAADDPLSQPLVRQGEQFARDIGSTSTPDFYVRKGGRLRPLNEQGTAPEDYARALDAILGSS